MTHRRAPRWSRSRLCADRSPSSNLVASLSLPSSLNMTGFDFFFSRFCLCFCIEEWMILYICLAIEKMWENATEVDDFFLDFVCISVLRNEWYIFVWQPRKCEQQVENMFFIIFSRTQPNTKKYFLKHF